MPEALFKRRNGEFMPTPHARGPWKGTLHGSAVAGLFGVHVEALLGGLPDFMLNRLTLDFMRAVPEAPLRVEVESLRDGGRLKLWQLRLRTGNTLVAQAVAVAQRRTAVMIPPTAPRPPSLSPLPNEIDESAVRGRLSTRHADPDPNLQSLLELRPLTQWNYSGAGTCWIRLHATVLDDGPPSPLLHAIMLGDMANGAAQLALSPGIGTINADISLSLHRYPVTGWLGIRARNSFEPHGTGIIHAELFDEQGGIGHVTQTVQAKTRVARP